MAATNINNKKHANNRWRGTSTVEAAVVLILLLIITLGTMGWGWFFLRIQQVTNAARAGARVASLYGSNASDVQDAVDSLLKPPVDIEHDSPDLPYGIDPGVGLPVKVTVKGKGLDILNLNPGGIIKIPIPDEFISSVTMAKEGP
jgi:hypothetical protein